MRSRRQGDVELRSGCATRGSTPNLPAHRLQLGERRSRFSWTVNRNQAGTQLFYFVNRADHLRDAPGIGFDAASGNFGALTAFWLESMMAPPPVPATAPNMGTRTMHP